MNEFVLHRGNSPVLISMPHNGQHIPADIAAAMHPFALTVPDTDWYLDKLYAFTPALGCSLINPRHSRYVIDLNRAPDGAVLYAGANNTELCPTSAFDLRPLYRDTKQPNAAEVQRRIALYWHPYHQALQAELARIKAEHGYAILFDAHSIQSQVPRFFEGRLPDINLGTADGKSCSPDMAAALMAVETEPFSKVINGRFKGGYITRHYGDPAQQIYAVQLELSQITYLNESNYEWRAEAAQHVMPVLEKIMKALLAWRPASVR